MASKKYASYRPTNSHLMGARCDRGRGLLERSVGKMMLYPVAPIAECMAKGPTTWGQRGFCKEEKIRGVVV